MDGSIPPMFFAKENLSKILAGVQDDILNGRWEVEDDFLNPVPMMNKILTDFLSKGKEYEKNVVRLVDIIMASAATGYLYTQESKTIRSMREIMIDAGDKIELNNFNFYGHVMTLAYHLSNDDNRIVINSMRKEYIDTSKKLF